MDIESHYLHQEKLSVVQPYLEPELMLASQNPKKRAGRKKFMETRHPIYWGVRSRKFGKWVGEVRHPITQSRVWLGTHDTADMAARAHDVAVLAMRGRSACLNFADSVWRLPIPQSSDVIDIQKAGAVAAKSFRPIVEIVKIVYQVDEDEIFGMIEGLMLPSPNTVGQGNIFDDVESFDDMPLWCS
uniref:DREB-like transcription factor n=1 Tax=Chrysanthemum morifolium TaxID=41568 RepID=B2BEA7_CHRMO|nr:DREB-like transcription factor [Chrysanthemum x morifolium]